MSWWEDSFVITGICVAFCGLQNTFPSLIIITIVITSETPPWFTDEETKIGIAACSWSHSFCLTKARIINPSTVDTNKLLKVERWQPFYPLLVWHISLFHHWKGKEHLQCEKGRPKLVGEKERELISGLSQIGLWIFKTICPSAPSVPAIPCHAIYRVCI